MRIIAGVVLIRTVAAVAALAATLVLGPAQAAVASLPTPLNASLRITNTSPRQNHGVLLDASASKGTITSYVFHYGDGTVESSYQPLALHGYRQPGVYEATVVIFDQFGERAISDPVTVSVQDGIPPVVRIASPAPDQRLHLGRSGVTIRGSATDAGGVRRVDVAIQLVSVGPGPGGECVWYNGSGSLVYSPCSDPYFFVASFAHQHWSMSIGPRANVFAGTYVIRVRATDRAGNVSSFYAIRLRTIVPFKLAP